MKKKAYFAGGCFWCIEPVFESLPGVSGAISGYSGGAEINPAYEDVKAQRTGHRETVCIEYDDALITFDTLLETFLGSVDPFDGGGQFIDRGHSYTLAVYCTDGEEKQITEAKLASLEQSAGKTVYISVEAFQSFYPAEEYHQDYYLKNPDAFQKELEESGRRRKAEG